MLINGIEPRKEAHESTLAEEADRITHSRALARSEQLRQMIRYLVDHEAVGDAAALSERAIAEAVFHRREFDPKQDTIVRAQASRLRRKIDEYYAKEAPEARWRLGFERNSYRPVLLPASPALVEGAGSGDRRVRSLWWLLTLAALAAGGLGFLLGRQAPPAVPGLGEVHPLWAPLLAAPTAPHLLVASPLFFSTPTGIVRDFRLNTPRDLLHADELLGRAKPGPQWDRWVHAGDAEGAIVVNSFLCSLRKAPELAFGPHITGSDLRRWYSVVIGHPRAILALTEALQDEEFFVRPPPQGSQWSGFLNRRPRAGESEVYSPPFDSTVDGLDDVLPDYALITAKRFPEGGYMVSLFGGRTQTSALLAKVLADRKLVNEQLPRKWWSGRAKTVQLVFRVEYAQGQPTALKFLTARTR